MVTFDKLHRLVGKRVVVADKLSCFMFQGTVQFTKEDREGESAPLHYIEIDSGSDHASVRLDPNKITILKLSDPGFAAYILVEGV